MCLIGKTQLLCMQCSGIGPHLVARGKSHEFSRVAAGTWGISSSYDGDAHSKREKEALKIYIKHYGDDTVEGIRHFCSDMEKAGLTGKYLKFANEVNKQQNVMELWDKVA